VIVMPANSTGWRVSWLQGRFGGLGHLFSPGAQRGPYPHMPYALDNGAFPAFTNGVEWREEAFVDLLRWASQNPVSPRWVVVPDVVGEAERTLVEWARWARKISGDYGFRIALAVQDGMGIKAISQLRPQPDVIFVGGTTEWKRKTIRKWCREFPRVHVGRVNTKHWLWECHHAGAESVDGTGWFRGDPKQLADLTDYLRENATQQPLMVPDWRDLSSTPLLDFPS